MLVGERVQIVDCVEFDRALRELDVADDLAFLVFDLAAHGGERFGALLVQAYRDAGGDPGAGLADRLLRRLPRARARQGRARAGRQLPAGERRARPRERAGAAT